MPRNTVNATPVWQLLTTSDVTGLFTVQARGHGRMFIARGDAVTPPPPGEGLFFDRANDGVGGMTLSGVDPGGVGNRLWVRFIGFGVGAVWCSWEDMPA
jgi:hypothetical protein